MLVFHTECMYVGRWNAIEFRQSQEEEEKEVYLSNIVHCTNIYLSNFCKWHYDIEDEMHQHHNNIHIIMITYTYTIDKKFCPRTPLIEAFIDIFIFLDVKETSLKHSCIP